MARFFIVVPTLNSDRFLDASLGSALLQTGNFDLHIHVQDGGSSDTTAQIVNHWSEWLSRRNRNIPSIQLTFRSATDNGLYDALDHAAGMISERRDQVMTWLGSDDLLLPGALATAASIFDQYPEILWITGLPFCGNEMGENYTLNPALQHYTRYHLCAGDYDGRSLEFVMQEGTFWRVRLWDAVGGVDPTLHLAGDWDLWRRFAQHTPLYTVTFPLARFTRRSGQKSQDMSLYYQEVDSARPMPVYDEFSSFHLIRPPWNKRWEIIEHKHNGPLVKKPQT